MMGPGSAIFKWYRKYILNCSKKRVLTDMKQKFEKEILEIERQKMI